MPTLNREQLNKILELMLENQASDPRSMLVVDGDKVVEQTTLDTLVSFAEEKPDAFTRVGERNIDQFLPSAITEEKLSADDKLFSKTTVGGVEKFALDAKHKEGYHYIYRTEVDENEKETGYLELKDGKPIVLGATNKGVNYDTTVLSPETKQRNQFIQDLANKKAVEEALKEEAKKRGEQTPLIAREVMASLVNDMSNKVKESAQKSLVLTDEESARMQVAFTAQGDGEGRIYNFVVVSPYGDTRVFDVTKNLAQVEAKCIEIQKSANQEDIKKMEDSIGLRDKETEKLGNLSQSLIDAKTEYMSYLNDSIEHVQEQVELTEQQYRGYLRFSGQLAKIAEPIDRQEFIRNEQKSMEEARAKQKVLLENAQKEFEKTKNEVSSNNKLSEEVKAQIIYSAEATLNQTKQLGDRLEIQFDQQLNSIQRVLDSQQNYGVDTSDLKEIKEKAEQAKKEFETLITGLETRFEVAAKRAGNGKIDVTIREIKDAHKKEIDAMYKEAEKAQDTSYKERIKALKGGILPSWLGGKTGLEKEIISTMADQSKAMETAQLVSVDVSSNPDQEGIELQTPEQIANKKRTEILAEKMRLRGLRDSIKASLEAHSVTEYDEERMEEGFARRYPSSSVDPDDLRLRASDSSVTTEASEFDPVAMVRDPEDKEQKLEVARGALAAATSTYAAAQDGLSQAQNNLARLEALKSRAQVKKELYEKLLTHAGGAATNVAGMNIVRKLVNEIKGLDEDQKNGMIQELDGESKSYKMIEARANVAAIVRGVSSVMGAKTDEEANKGFSENSLEHLIDGIDKTIKDLNDEVESSQAIKQSLEEDIGTAKSQVAQATLDVQSRENEVSLVKQRQEEHGYRLGEQGISYSPSTSSASNDDNTSLISGNSGYDSDSNEGRLDNTFETFSVFGSGVSRIESPFMGLPSTEEVMTILDENAEQSLLARKKLALLAKLEVMSPAMTDENGKLTISDDYVEKLQKLEALYSGPTAESLQAYDDEVSSQPSFGSLAGGDVISRVTSSGSEASTEAGPYEDGVDATFPTDESLDGPTPQDLVARYNLCFENLQQEIKDNPYLGVALTGRIGGELTAGNLQEVAKQASAITEAEVAKASISRKDAQQITDAAMRQLLTDASGLGINLHALTFNKGDNELFKKLKEQGVFDKETAGLVEKGELDFSVKALQDRRFWHNCAEPVVSVCIKLLNAIIKWINTFLDKEFKESSEYGTYRVITASDIAKVAGINEGDAPIVGDLRVEAFKTLRERASRVEAMQQALSRPKEQFMPKLFSDFTRVFTDITDKAVAEATKGYREALVTGEGLSSKKFDKEGNAKGLKGFKSNVRNMLYNARFATSVTRFRGLIKDLQKQVKDQNLTREQEQAVAQKYQNTVIMEYLGTVPLANGKKSLADIFTPAEGGGLVANQAIEMVNGLGDDEIGRNIPKSRILEMLNHLKATEELVQTQTDSMDYTELEKQILHLEEGIERTKASLDSIHKKGQEEQSLQAIDGAIEEAESVVKERGLEGLVKVFDGKTIDQQVKEKSPGTYTDIAKWAVNLRPRATISAEILAAANAKGVSYTDSDVKFVDDFLQLQALREEVRQDTTPQYARTQASVKDKELHKEVKALYQLAREAFPAMQNVFDPTKLEKERDGKIMKVALFDEGKGISMPTRMIPVYIAALKKADLSQGYREAKSAAKKDASSKVEASEAKIIELTSALESAEKALEAAKTESSNVDEVRNPMLNEEDNSAVVEAAAKVMEVSTELAAEQASLEVLKEAVANVDDALQGFNVDKINKYNEALTKIDNGLDARVEEAVSGRKEYAERKAVKERRTGRTGDLIESLKGAPKPAVSSSEVPKEDNESGPNNKKRSNL